MATMDEQPKVANAPPVTKVENGAESGSSPEHAKRNLEEEFNAQRAKMKELFMQKEEDFRRMVLDKEQLDSEVLSLREELQQLQTLSQNQKSEIQSLQMLVNETVEASSSGTEDLRRLHAKNVELEQQLTQLRQQPELSLAPATFVRSLARKLGADTELEHTPKKNTDDNELLRSIIEPLEMEITALKHKLRETDAQLQEELKSKALATQGHSTNAESEKKTESDANTSVTDGRPCDMCANYERQLVAEQAAADAARDRAAHLQLSLRLAREELEGVRSVQDETVRAWAGERGERESMIEKLAEQLAEACAYMSGRAAGARDAEERALQAVTALTVERETLQRRLDSLERDNAILIGQFLKKAEEMQNDIINLPDNVEELQEQALRIREQLIVCSVGREQLEASEAELRTQLLAHAQQLLVLEGEEAALRRQWQAAREELDQFKTEREQMNELANKLRHSNDMIEQLLEDKKRLQNEAAEVRSRVLVLQQELDNSEKVQQDFVRLSQSLQVQLQRIREADTEVRWQHDDDVSECSACRAPLAHSRKKVHCRHCGRIFCAACVPHVVNSGPRGRPARVCEVCRTLLQPHTAPYFSTAPPQHPA